ARCSQPTSTTRPGACSPPSMAAPSTQPRRDTPPWPTLRCRRCARPLVSKLHPTAAMICRQSHRFIRRPCSGRAQGSRAFAISIVWSRAGNLQLHIPVLADDLLAEAAARLARGQAKAGLRVDMTRRGEHAMRPERHTPIAAFAREADAFVGQPFADAKTARRGLDQQEAQARDLVGVLRQQHRADVLPVELCNPSTFPARIEPVDKIGDDLGAHALELLAPAIFTLIEHGMPLH